MKEGEPEVNQQTAPELAWLREPQWPTSDDLGSVALLLDVDGTVLDIAPTPGSVVVPKSLCSSLEALHRMTDGALALVSGRSVRNLDALFSPLRLPTIGGHGAEIRIAGQDIVETAFDNALRGVLRDDIVKIAEVDPRIIFEDKGSSIAIHFRLAPELGPMVESAVLAAVERGHATNLEAMCGKAVIEIKPKMFNKGTAVRDLMRIPPFARRRPVFIGDDTTDETVFRVLPGLNGCGYSVGRFVSGVDGSFERPADVRSWLAGLAGCEVGV